MSRIDECLAKLGPMQLDAIREVASIGAGNAATSLSEMLEGKIQMKVPRVGVLPIENIPEIMGGIETSIIAILVRIEGDMNGGVLFSLNADSANKLLTLLLGEKIEIKEDINEIEDSALKELANILAGSNLNAFSQIFNIKIKPDVPSLAYDMAGAILGVVFIELGQIGDYSLVIETEILSDIAEDIKAHFLLIPDTASLEFMLNRLGVAIEEG